MNIPWSRPCFGSEESEAVQRVMDSGWVTQGPETKKFEEEIESFIGCKHACIVNNGTAALAVALLARKPEKVILPAYCYSTLINLVRLFGIHFSFCDIDPNTVHIKKEKLGKEWTYIPTSYAGLPLDPNEWMEMDVIEDAGEAFGSIARKRVTGSNWMTTFSFHVAKVISMVEGGVVTTNDDELANLIRQIRHRGYLNFQTTDIASAIGRVQLSKLPKFLENRKYISKIYREELEGLVNFQLVPDYVEVHSNMMFPIFVNNPKELSFKLKNRGIDTRLSWESFSQKRGVLEVRNRIICLPIFNDMTYEQTIYVINAIKEVLL